MSNDPTIRYIASKKLQERFLRAMSLIDERRRISAYRWEHEGIRRCDFYLKNLLHKKAIRAIARTRNPDEWTPTEHYCVQCAVDLNASKEPE
jgi:hypothetical protein